MDEHTEPRTAPAPAEDRPVAPAPALAHTVAGSTTSRVLASLAVLGVCGALAATGTHATFTASAQEAQTVTTGTLVLELGATGSVTNRLDLAAADLLPGTTFQRSVTVSNPGAQSFANFTFSTAATTSSLLDTDPTHGLQLELQRCSQQWTEAGTAPNLTYTCGGTTTTLVPSRPIIGTGLALSGMSSAASGGTDHLRVRVTLPTSAGDAFQGKTSTIQYTFNAAN